MMRGLILFAFGMLGLMSCQDRSYFVETQIIDSAGWEYDQPKRFDVEIADTSVRFNIMLEIVHSTDYVHENVYLETTTTYPEQEARTQSVPINFATKTGAWLGDCSGKACTLHVMLQENAFFSELGKHSITFGQFTRADPLMGLQSLTLIMQEIEKH